MQVLPEIVSPECATVLWTLVELYKRLGLPIAAEKLEITGPALNFPGSN